MSLKVFKCFYAAPIALSRDILTSGFLQSRDVRSARWCMLKLQKPTLHKHFLGPSPTYCSRPYPVTRIYKFCRVWP